MSRNAALKREARKYKDAPIKPSNVLQYEQEKTKLKPLNESQRQFISALYHDELVIGAGKAGTGKTFIASIIAGEIYLKDKNIRNIIMTRPNVEVGEKLGFLPGELDEKYAPYMEPFEKGLKQVLGNRFGSDMGKGLQPMPLGYMRGKTFDDSVILLDEAQNTTIEQMKMFLTRVGTNSRVFITGDDTNGQNDLRVKENGLQWLIRQFESQNLHFEVVKFTTEDCVRSGLCKQMLTMIDRET